jgi:predicted secreted hydrolase
MIRESAWAMCFDIPFPGRGYFRGEITKLAPPLVIEGGILYEEPDTSRSSHWVVQVPHATFTGILQLDGVTQRLCGTAYQDHQWGTILIQEFVSDWVWGHFSNEETAVVFFQILTQHGQIIERVAMMNREGRYAGTAVETSYLDTLFQTDNLDNFESEIAVSFLNRQLQFDFAISSANLMRSRLNEEHNQTVASYLRWSAAAALEMGCGYLPLHGISEYIRIRPAMYGSLS